MTPNQASASGAARSAGKANALIISNRGSKLGVGTPFIKVMVSNGASQEDVSRVKAYNKKMRKRR